MRTVRVLFALLIFIPMWAQKIPTQFYELRPYYDKLVPERKFDRAAQTWSESGFNRLAVSPVNAKGLNQFMDPTWGDMIKAKVVPRDASPFDVEPAIVAQNHYMNSLEARARNLLGPKVIKDLGWLDMGLGAYNCGWGNVLKAHWLATQQLGLQEPDAWKKALPQITKQHARETLGYIPRIKARSAILQQKWTTDTR